MKRVGLLAIVVAVIGAAIWLLNERSSRAPLAHPATPAEVSAAAAPEVERATVPTAEPERVAAPEAAAMTVVRGRCVDQSGAPLAGCAASLHGWGGDGPRLDAYLVEHDELEWEDPAPQATAADGRFAFLFVPPPLQFNLDLIASGKLRMYGTWTELLAGTTKDLGDIVMLDGCAVRGEVVDARGRPVAGAGVCGTQDRNVAWNPSLSPCRSTEVVQAQSDGSFAFGHALRSGTWDMHVWLEGKTERSTFEIPEGATTHFVRVTFAPSAPAPQIEQGPRITGIVVDDAGKPVVGARIEPAQVLGFAGRGTDKQGRFSIDKPDHVGDEPVRLQLRCKGYHPLDPEESFAWGTRDLRFVMQRGAVIEVLAVDAASNQPIEQYALRAFRNPGTPGQISSRDFGLRARGRHAGGKTELSRMTPGTYLLVVQPRGDDWCDVFHECEITAAPRQRHVVRVPATARRSLVVHTTAGAPIAGTRVELLAQLTDVPVDLATYVFDLAQDGFTGHPNQARLVMKGTTDQRGELTLVGPPDLALQLRLLGPGHTPLVVHDVRLDRPEPLELTVAVGATLIGKVRPARLVAQMRATGGNFRPGLCLQRGTERMPAGLFFERFEFDDDGGVRIEGVAAGTWEVQLRWATPNGPGVQPHTVTLETVRNLRDGEERVLEYVLDHLVHGTLRGTLRRSGQPYVGQAMLEADQAIGADGSLAPFSRQITTDAEGRFEAALPEGEYRATLTWFDATREPHQATAATIVFVPREQDVEAVFEVSTATLRITLVREDGAPIFGVPVRVQQAGARLPTHAPPTDAEGATVLAEAPVGRLQASVVRRDLLDPRVLMSFEKANRSDLQALASAFIELDSITVRDGEPNVVRLVVPARAGY